MNGLFYASSLVPRWIAMCGLIGGPLIFASSIAVLFGAVYTLAKGFRPSPILTGEPVEVRVDAR